MSLFLLPGQFSVRNTAAFILSLSCSVSLQSYNMWPTVCSHLLQEHIGLSMILYLCRYDIILPCHVTIVMKFGITLIFSCNLSAISGKNDFLIAPFVVRSIHFATSLHLDHLVHLSLYFLECFCSTRQCLCW